MDSEDEDTKSCFSAPARSGSRVEGQTQQGFQNIRTRGREYTRRKMQDIESKVSLKSMSAKLRKHIGNADSNETNHMPDSAEKGEFIKYGDKTQSESAPCGRSKSTYTSRPKSSIAKDSAMSENRRKPRFHARESVRGSRQSYAMVSGVHIQCSNKSSCLFSSESSKTSEKGWKNPFKGKTWNGFRKRGKRLSEKMKSSLDEYTPTSTDDMNNSKEGNVTLADRDRLPKVKSSSRADLETEERQQEKRNTTTKNGLHTKVGSEKVVAKESTKYDKDSKEMNQEKHNDQSQRYKPPALKKLCCNKSHDSIPLNTKSIRNRRKNSKNGDEDVYETSVANMNKITQSLLKRNSVHICTTLAKEKRLLKKLVEISCMNQELLVDVIALIEKALTSRVSQQSGYSLIIVLKDTGFFELAIVPFLSDMLTDESIVCFSHLSTLKNIIKLVHIFLSRSPTSMVLTFGLLDLLHRISENLQVMELTDTSSLREIKEGILEIDALKENHVSKRAIKSVTNRTSSLLLPENEEPPENFRELEVYPQLKEIKAENRPFLRANKEIGEYMDLNHYLDVQYRLLREDFICPLREGIKGYRWNQCKNNKTLQDLRLYDDVKIRDLALEIDGIYHRLSFDVSRLRHVEWKHSKRLIYGSFLCLSSDDFDTMLFATVAARDPILLQNGIVRVSFQTDLTDVMKKSHQSFVMAESIAFFEAYKHVLLGLQNVVTLPFEKHLVNCVKEVDPPAYLSHTDSKVYDLEPLLDSRRDYPQSERLENRDPRVVQIMNLSDWPSAAELGLDKSQWKAIQTALTHEFSIIQGPPGTGKTYVGLQIVKVLLKNMKVWVPQKLATLGSPLLIVCYTNHALDQFLEGILKFYSGDIVRVGGRSLSEALSGHTLNQFRQNFRNGRLIPRGIFLDRIITREQVKRQKVTVKAMAKALKWARDKILVTEHELCPYMKHHYESLMSGFEKLLWNNIHMLEKFARNGMQSWIIEEWLGYGYLTTRNDDIVNLVLGMDESVDNAAMRSEDICDITENLYVNVVDVANAMEIDRVMEDDCDDLDFFIDTETTHGEDMTEIIGERRHHREDEYVHEKRNGYWETSRSERKKLKREFKKQLYATSVMEESEADNVVDVWELDYKNKWRLYRYWRQLYLNALEEDFVRSANSYANTVKEYKEARMKEDQFVLKRANIIGMTTTCAARYRPVLQEIGPKIVIVEEAAEVLESHIITTLSEHCQHLILIGDHEQLRPNPTVYTLAKDYKLDISLFERMVNNGIQCDCLEEQHRMRPEIAMLLRHIYPNLRNHASVSEYKNIEGVGTNIFFIDHTEEESDDVDKKSHLNEHEARYIVALCKYLLQQGYTPNQITVLTTYSAQLFCLRKMMPKSDFEGVTVTAVDNYQGEENDIILLSMVRSNHKGKIGFLKCSNRICVALSRAMKGFYAIGNFSFLAELSKLWADIVATLQRENKIGKALALYCENHPKYGFEAADAADFGKSAPEGGCQRKCEARLACGHSCKRLCHPSDRNHEQYQCKKPCERICENGHICKKFCYQDCDCPVTVEKNMPKCSHTQSIPCCINTADVLCKVLVTCTLRKCGHTVTTECCQDLTQVECPVQCEERLTCGHVCQRKCGEEHTTTCMELINETLECGHMSRRNCYVKRSDVLCRGKCLIPLKCGHACQNICGEKHDHNHDCKQMVTKYVPGCGHSVRAFCYIPGSKLKCNKTRQVDLICGHTLTTICGQDSARKCNFMIKKTFECGHTSKVPCHNFATQICAEKCKVTLACGHKCSGNCTECFKGRLHKRCSVQSVEFLICGHNRKALCSFCPPCERNCNQGCPHNACMNVCSRVCEPCNKPCIWSCQHLTCTKTCSEICDRAPCNEPCQEVLHCGHPCIGICGEPCPRLCRICDKEKVTMRRFGKENSLRSRFVQLLDCEDVVEVTSMDRWIQHQMQREDLSEIQFPVCPCCGIPIRNSVRYQRELKHIQRAINDVKLQLRRSVKKEPFPAHKIISMIKVIESKLKINAEVNFDEQLTTAFKKNVETFKKWILKLKYDVTPQHHLDIKDELIRLQIMVRFITSGRKCLDGEDKAMDDLREAVKSTRTVLLSGERLGPRYMSVERCVEKLARLSTSSASERHLMTYNAPMEVKREWLLGSWQICTTGHVFHRAELIRETCPKCLSTLKSCKTRV